LSQAASNKNRHVPRIAPEIQAILVCPHEHRSPLALSADKSAFTCATCGRSYPILDGAPILINEDTSAFRLADYLGASSVDEAERASLHSRRSFIPGLIKKLLARLTPSLSIRSSNFDANDALTFISREVPNARILTVGCGDLVFTASRGANVTYTDIQLTDLAQLVCDAHNLPFSDESFDAVLAVAVLEHVADPARCVAEFCRVLKAAGFVYAETPFMQQVHLGAYDFHRFTLNGHRRLLRQFSEIKSDIVGGPAMALAWSFEYFLSSFSERQLSRKLLKTIAKFLAAPLKYLDRFLVHKRGAIDCASSFYFFGRKSSISLTDREIVQAYRGLNPE